MTIPEIDISASTSVDCPGCGRSLRLGAAGPDSTGLCPYCACEMRFEDEDGGGNPSLSESGEGSLVGRDLGSYRLERILGRGGMGTVYLARDRRTEAQVAIKVLRGDLARRPAAADRFEREAQLLALLDHPNIVALLDRGREGEIDYLVMERVGTGAGAPASIKTLLRRGGLTIPRSIQIVRSILIALEAAHASGIVHRDIKPTNVLLDERGGVKVTDFGVARFAASLGGAPGASSGEPRRLDTSSYLAPEQQRDARTIDPRSDLYSVGVLLYEMLVGQRPGWRYVPPSELLPGLGGYLDDFLRLVLAEDPEDRPPTAAAMRAELDRRIEGPTSEEAQRESPPPPERAAEGPPPGGARFGRGGWLVFAFVVIATVGVYRFGPTDRSAAPGSAGAAVDSAAGGEAIRERADALAREGRPLAAARTLQERMTKSGKGWTSSDRERLEEWVLVAIRDLLAEGKTDEAGRALDWWTGCDPAISPERVRSLQGEILVRELSGGLEERDFSEVAAALAYLRSIEFETDPLDRDRWCALLEAGLLESASAGRMRVVEDALGVLESWGSATQRERAGRLVHFFAPFRTEARLAGSYRPYVSADLSFGLPIRRDLVVENSDSDRLVRFRFPGGGGEGAGSFVPLQIVRFPSRGEDVSSLEAQARFFRDRLQSEDPRLLETQHSRVDLSGVACETFVFRRPGEGEGLATFVELFVFRRGAVVFMVTLILPEGLVRELRPDLLFSLSHLKVFE